MAFNPKNKKITDAVKHIPDTSSQNKSSESNIFTVPILKKEKTKTYTFTMRPEIRKKLSKLSKSHGFKSDSAFLTYLIEHVE